MLSENLIGTFLLSGGALADGFQVRMFEFQNFERRFEVSVKCCSIPFSPEASQLTPKRLGSGAYVAPCAMEWQHT